MVLDFFLLQVHLIFYYYDYTKYLRNQYDFIIMFFCLFCDKTKMYLFAEKMFSKETKDTLLNADKSTEDYKNNVIIFMIEKNRKNFGNMEKMK